MGEDYAHPATEGDGMTQIAANVGESPRREDRRFAEFVFWAIEASESIKALSLRWGVPEETIRRYRDGNATPSFDRLREMRLNDAERMSLLRLLAAGRVKIELLDVDERDRVRQGRLIGIPESELRGQMIEFTGKAQAVVEVLHESLADGQVDAHERQKIEATIDSAQAAARRLRPSFWGKVRSLLGR